MARKDMRLSYKKKVGTFRLPDLIVKRPDKKLLNIGAAPIDVTVTFPKDVGETAWKKYYAPIISREAERYQEIIEQEAAALAKKIAAFKEGGDIKKAEQMVSEATLAINGAVRALGTQLPAQIDGELAKQSKRDKSLRNARAKVAFKAGRIVVSLSANIATLVGSGGADLSAYVSIAKELKSAGELIYQQAKGEKKLRNDLHRSFQAFLDSVEGSAGTAQGALKAYRNHSTKTKNQILSTAKGADKLSAKMKAAKDLKGGVKLGAKAMEAKREAGRLIEKYGEREAYADEYEKYLQDSTRKLKGFVAKELAGKYETLVVKKGKGLDEFVTYAEKFLDAADEIYSNVTAFTG